ncbi:guanine nucleotide exchange factor C9orf72-like isoform X1 [Schistocerca piceifrons]|uniref:guanine nucleotide exchange factor C9orf72-like isoform X1 n=1 Tax=Schistocerca piceifrons TaxID=274613 RepID=UPI001F5F4DEF|nr:guanine nucleotide exchange factor C9orf72-like isoform X1 [Schistocerca piceifrons]
MCSMLVVMDARTALGKTCQLLSERKVENQSECPPVLCSEGDCLNVFDGKEEKEFQMVRSLAMSANIANAVKNEVKHLIHISAIESCAEKNMWVGATTGSKLPTVSYTANASFSSSFVLPSAEEHLISVVVLSRWDDIMGPQTVHVWMEQAEKSTCNIDMIRAIRYVTNHTVSQAAETSAMGPKIFVVSDLDIIAQSLTFGVRVHRGQRRLPHSISVLVSLSQYSSFLELRCLCHQWLIRTAARLQTQLQGPFNCAPFITNDKLDGWMMELCYMLVSVKSCGFGTVPDRYSSEILDHPLIERALTSHLQTFGCTVVMGTSATDINQFIYFLAQFLSASERVCSRLVIPNVHYPFHVGLYLQGLLLDEFGCRELCSTELSSNPYPVTAIDLTQTSQIGAVKQTFLLPFNSDGCLVNAQGRVHATDDVTGVHGRILHPVKDSASLVQELLKDLRRLQPPDWAKVVTLFVQKISTMAHCLLSQIHCLRYAEIVSSSVFGSPPHRHFLMKCLNLEDSDFRIVLAAAEKLKPGVYSYILKPLQLPREDTRSQMQQIWLQEVPFVETHPHDT